MKGLTRLKLCGYLCQLRFEQQSVLLSATPTRVGVETLVRASICLFCYQCEVRKKSGKDILKETFLMPRKDELAVRLDSILFLFFYRKTEGGRKT